MNRNLMFDLLRRIACNNTRLRLHFHCEYCLRLVLETRAMHFAKRTRCYRAKNLHNNALVLETIAHVLTWKLCSVIFDLLGYSGRNIASDHGTGHGVRPSLSELSEAADDATDGALSTLAVGVRRRALTLLQKSI